MWNEDPGRPADIYIFAWRPETKEDLVDHRAPEQWTFYAIPTEVLPAVQRSIDLARIESLTRKVLSDSLAPAVEQLLKRRSKVERTGS